MNSVRKKKSEWNKLQQGTWNRDMWSNLDQSAKKKSYS